MARSKHTQEAIAGALSLEQSVESVGLGVDVVEVERMQRVIDRTPSFKEKVFSEQERTYCEARPNPAMHYAARFAAKEAVVKALGIGFAQGIGVLDIEVVRTETGAPAVVLTGRAKEIAAEKGIVDIPVSLSHTKHDAVACAMALTKNAAIKKVAKVNPAEELARQFKNARDMLDDLPATPVQTEAHDSCAEQPENNLN